MHQNNIACVSFTYTWLVATAWSCRTANRCTSDHSGVPASHFDAFAPRPDNDGDGGDDDDDDGDGDVLPMPPLPLHPSYTAFC
jgi:hypothetical protein